MEFEFHKDKALPEENSIFVFGSNLAGRHGLGAALLAKEKYGAIYGQPVGLQGNSYGIPTKGIQLDVLPIKQIERHVNDFISFAKENRQFNFFVTRIGCGLAGYKDSEIAPLFNKAPSNCNMPENWKEYLKVKIAPKSIKAVF